MKLFVIFGIICFVNPEAPRGISCIEYIEPEGKVYNKEECYEHSKLTGDAIAEELNKNGIEIMEQIIWCVKDKGEPA